MNKLAAVPTITDFAPTTITAGPGSELTINGTNFGAVQGAGFVEFKNGDNGGATFIEPIASDYTSWTDTQIKVKVPGTPGHVAGTGVISVTNSDPNSVTSAQTLTVSYVYQNIIFDLVARMPNHVSDNGAGGYTFQMEGAEFAANAGASDAFRRAMDTWTCATEINWIIGANTAVDVIASDGVNVVRFDNGAELPAGVGGRMTNRIAVCGPPPSAFLLELDVAFDDGQPWQFGPALPAADQIDFESIALHELGHGHLLGHIILPGAVLDFDISNGETARVLSAGNDIAGGNFVKARGLVANACGPGPMTAGACVPVPIQLASISASLVRANDVEVSWHTVSETNNYGFEVERKRIHNRFPPRADAPAAQSGLMQWTNIAFVQGHGTTLEPQFYSYTDRSVPFGKYYYRIKQIDLDGKWEIFPNPDKSGSEPGMEVTVGVGPDNFILAQNYPNPFNPNTVIEFVVPQSGFATLKVYNVLGQQVKSLFEGNAEAGRIHGANFEASNLPSGIYFYTLRYGGKVETKRMLLMR